METSQTVIEARRQHIAVLEQEFSHRESEQLVRILLEDLFGLDATAIAMHPERVFTEEMSQKMTQAVAQLLLHRPIQYVIGEVSFNDLRLHVDESVLIPRPETEEMLHRIIAMEHRIPIRRIWDIGTGSGCIAISMAKAFPEAEVYAFDVSSSALSVACDNAQRNGVTVHCVEDDILHPSSTVLEDAVDLIVSNPPYVCDSERADMERHVLDYEPSNALFVPDDDPLLFYRQILLLAQRSLTPGGEIWFEINEAKGEEMLALCRSHGYDHVQVLEDYTGRKRFVAVLSEKF